MNAPTVPCGLCSTPTPMLGTKRCDACWELETRIKGNPALALRILTSLPIAGRQPKAYLNALSEEGSRESLIHWLVRLDVENDALRAWLDGNTTYFDVVANGPKEGPNIPVLAAVSKRIWYHATDDQAAYPFSRLADKALAGK